MAPDIKSLHLIGEQTLAPLLDVPVQTLRKWRSKNSGPPWIKLERCVKYPVAGVATYLAQNTRQPADEAA